MSEHFSDDELRCKCGCGQVIMQEIFMVQLEKLRRDLGTPMNITSGSRCENHPNEKKKAIPGAHYQGCAVDVQISGVAAYRLVGLAIIAGFTGIGVMQHGPYSERFIHLDTASSTDERPRPHVWSYK